MGTKTKSLCLFAIVGQFMVRILKVDKNSGGNEVLYFASGVLNGRLYGFSAKCFSRNDFSDLKRGLTYDQCYKNVVVIIIFH